MTGQDRARSRGGLDATVPHHDTAYKIIGAAMEVHNKVGPGHREEVYQQAMLKKLPEVGLTTQEQVPVEVTLGRSRLEYRRILPPRKIATQRRREWTKPLPPS